MPIKLSEQEYKDILITAVEGGCNHWAWSSNYKPDSGSVTFESFDGDTADITIDDVELALNELLELSDVRDDIKQALMSGQWDAECADCVIQWAMFNELVYS